MDETEPEEMESWEEDLDLIEEMSHQRREKLTLPPHGQAGVKYQNLELFADRT